MLLINKQYFVLHGIPAYDKNVTSAL